MKRLKPPLEPRSVRLRLICETPPHYDKRFDVGLQDKQQVLHHGRERSDGSVEYEFTLSVQRRQGDRLLRFSGPFAHGRAADPFLYLGLRNGDGEWVRRLKVPLSDIAWELVVAAEDGLLEGRVDGAGSARTCLLGEGWQVRSESPDS